MARQPKVPPIKENIITIKFLKVDDRAERMYVIFRTAETPKAVQEDPFNPVTDPVEFKFIDQKNKVYEKGIADTLGKALDYGAAWAQKHQMVYSDQP